MKLRFLSLLALVAGCVAHGTVLAIPTSTAAASASSLRFDVTSLDPYGTASITFGPPSPEATIVQAFADDGLGTPDFTFDLGTDLFSTVSTTASVGMPAHVIANAASDADVLSATGTANVGSGFYAATAGLNQLYGDLSTQGGWFTLSARSKVTFSGQIDLFAAVGGELCDTTGLCSTAFAEIQYRLGDDLQTLLVEANGNGDVVLSQIVGETFTLSFENDTNDALDVFFAISATVSGSTAGVVDGGGAVPAPPTAALVLLALAGLAARRPIVRTRVRADV